MNPRYSSGKVRRFALACASAVCFAAGAYPAQAAAAAANSAQNAGSEITSQESQPAFELHVQHNEVILRVVVRDSKGNAVTNLHQEDFRIFDRGKLQTITHFAMETTGSGPVAAAPASTTAATVNTTSAAAPIILATRYVGMFFDDIHLEFGDLARTRAAADKYLASNLKPGDRAGIFTSSGQNQLGFTDDPAKLHDALLKIVPRPITSGPTHECPEISPYQAYMIVEVNDPTAMEVAQGDARYVCCPRTTGSLCPQADASYIQNLAQSIFDASDVEPQYVFQGLEHLCRILGTFVGQRSIVMVSPGFLTLDMTPLAQLQHVIDEALRENVVIGTIDARGLYADVGLGDASQQAIGDPTYFGLKSQWQNLTRTVNDDVLGSLADGTGGTFFENNNDFAVGFRRAGGLPEAYYVLAFAPQDLKTDGRFHALKVALADNPGHFTLQTRKGYFAPTKVEDAATVAREEMEQMVFSQEEVQPIPLEVRTQFFKGPAGDARLTVVTHVDISHLRFQKANDRNLETLTMITAVFDRSGSCVKAEQKRIELRLLDSTLARLVQSGMGIKTEVNVKPGPYLVREVVQESEGGQISALNTQVEIP